MEFICILFLIMFIVLSRQYSLKAKGYGISLAVIYNVYWVTIVSLGLLHLYGLYEISNIVYTMVLIGSLGFTVGYLVSGNLLKIKNKLQKGASNKAGDFNYPFFIALGFAVYVIIKQIILLLPVIMVSGVGEARGEMQVDDTMILGGGWDVLLAYFAKPFIKATIIILLVKQFQNKIKISHISIVVILLLLYFLSEGGRGILLQVLFALVYLFITNRHKLSHKNIRRIKLTLVVLAILPVLGTLDRGSKVLFSLYTYYTGGLQYLTQAIQLRQDIFDENLYGVTCFQGVLKPIFGLLQLFGVDKPEAINMANQFIYSSQDTVFNIAPNCPMNYFMTCFGYAYKDGGLLGCFVILLIFGILSNLVDQSERRNSNNVRIVSIKIMFFVGVMFTMTSFPFAAYLTVLPMFYAMLITSNLFQKKIKK